MHAVRYHQYGPPDVLQYEEVPDPTPGPGEVLVQVTAAGLNLSEVQRRAGGFKEATWFAEPPTIPGAEVAGTVIALGPDADPGLLGQRVAGRTGMAGGYAELAVLPAEGLQAIPPEVTDQQAIAVMVQGVIALGVLERSPVVPGERVLVDAAAGGIGSLLVQLVRTAGAGTVVAASGGPRKVALTRQLGADIAVDYSVPDWTATVLESLDGERLDVAYESVGGDLARDVMDLLIPNRGRLVTYGLGSGTWPRIDAGEVGMRGIGLIGYAGLHDSAADLTRRTAVLYERLITGTLRPVIGQVLPLAEAAKAHALFEARDTVGKTILVP